MRSAGKPLDQSESRKLRACSSHVKQQKVALCLTPVAEPMLFSSKQSKNIMSKWFLPDRTFSFKKSAFSTRPSDHRILSVDHSLYGDVYSDHRILFKQ